MKNQESWHQKMDKIRKAEEKHNKEKRDTHRDFKEYSSDNYKKVK